MRYEKIGGTTHIHIEEGETERQILRVIVKASFELARAVGPGWLHFNDSQGMTNKVADQFISLPSDYGDTVVQMNYVQGRQCKTYIKKVDNNHFILINYAYERDRGTPEPMLDRAKEILGGKKSTGLASTSYMYRGKNLTLRLKEYGYIRRNGESDWDFRKRIFPDFFQKSADRAMEFLMGASAAEWEKIEQILCLALVSKGEPSHYELVKFANGFAADPIQMRERKQTT